VCVFFFGVISNYQGRNMARDNVEYYFRPCHDDIILLYQTDNTTHLDPMYPHPEYSRKINTNTTDKAPTLLEVTFCSRYPSLIHVAPDMG
jgi:hypothetical protein